MGASAAFRALQDLSSDLHINVSEQIGLARKSCQLFQLSHQGFGKNGICRKFRTPASLRRNSKSANKPKKRTGKKRGNQFTCSNSIGASRNRVFAAIKSWTVPIPMAEAART